MPTDLRAELRAGIGVALGVLVTGVPIGVLWWLVAPLPRLVVRANGIYLTEGETEVAVAADGWFAVCSLTAGLVVALVVFARIRRSRVGALLGLAVGGLLAAVVAWRLGAWLGPGSIRSSAKGLADQARFNGPLELSAKGVLFTWPIASVVAFFALTAGLEPPVTGTAGERAGQRFPVTVLRPGYSIAEVDAVFARLHAGDLSTDEARATRFSSGGRWRRGYDEASVDAALSEPDGALTSRGQIDGSARPSPG